MIFSSKDFSDVGAFLPLLAYLRHSPSSAGKLKALVGYFQLDEHQVLAALAILTGKYFSPKVRPALLKQAVLAQTGLPEWLYQECALVVKDPAETAALLLPPSDPKPFPPLQWWLYARSLSSEPDSGKSLQLQEIWTALGSDAFLPFHEWLLGKFTSPVSIPLVVKAFSLARSIPFYILVFNMARLPDPGKWSLEELALDPPDEQLPFHVPELPYWEGVQPILGFPLLAGYIPHGISCQLVWFQGQVQLWAGQQDLAQILEFSVPLQQRLPGSGRLEVVLVPGTPEEPAPPSEINVIQNLSPGSQKYSKPFFLLAVDLLSLNGKDLRKDPFFQRRAALEKGLPFCPDPMVFAIPLVPLQSYEEAKALWETSEGSKAAYIRIWATQTNAAEPLHPGSWVWKKEPETVYLVLVHVRFGNRGTGLGEDVQLSFGAAHENGFRVVAHGQVPFSADESSKLQTFIRTHTLERFGPVRTLVPKAVFKVRYRQIQPAPRTKAGIVLSEVEVVAWQPDMTPDEVISLSRLTKNGFQTL